MKVTKDGKLKLSKDERQIGNFLYKNEPEHIKICDINSQMTHRVAKHLNIGRMLEMALKEKQDKQASEIAADRKSQVGTGDRSERIRTYNYPQGRLTDHRIGLTLYKLEDILNGNLDEVIDALVTADRAEKLKESMEQQ